MSGLLTPHPNSGSSIRSRQSITRIDGEVASVPQTLAAFG
jgi:hypothetical protein